MDNSNLDILAINETKLDSSISNNEIHFEGYDVVRLDREVNGRYGGGVCIYIRNNRNFRIREDLIDKNLELLMIEIVNPRSRLFLVGTWYRPPSSPGHSITLFEKIIDISIPFWDMWGRQHTFIFTFCRLHHALLNRRLINQIQIHGG